MAMFEASLRPPPDGGGVLRPSWCLLDVRAYLADRKNATTASAPTRTGGDLKVTFCVAEPPRLSYICVHLEKRDGDGAQDHGRRRVVGELAMEPTIMAVEDRFVLFCADIYGSTELRLLAPIPHYYMYIAAGADKQPSLTLLPNPSPNPSPFGEREVGILPRPSQKDSNGYLVAALHRASHVASLDAYELHLFDSKAWQWSSKVLSIGGPQLSNDISLGYCSKTITIGRRGCSMGWAFLWRGIVFCDVLRKYPVLLFVPFPTPILGFLSNMPEPRWHRDVLVTKDGTINYIETDVNTEGTSFTEGWSAVTWNCLPDDSTSWKWKRICPLKATDISIDDDNQSYSAMLHRLHGDEATKPSLKGLHMGEPALSLQDDDLVYLMTNVSEDRRLAWVLAIDMGKKKLQGVAGFDAKRTWGLCPPYLQSRISKYLAINDSSRYGSFDAKMSVDGIAQASKLMAIDAASLKN